MKINNVRKIAQGTTTSKFDKKINNAHGEIMKKPHLSIESFHKLNRSNAVAGYLHNDLLSCHVGGRFQLFLPHIFSYIHDDITEALEELKEKGLCDEWLRQERMNIEKE